LASIKLPAFSNILGNSGFGSSDSEAKTDSVPEQIIIEVYKNDVVVRNMELVESQFLVGSSLDSDILLFEDEEESWFDFEILSSFFGHSVRLAPISPDLTLNGRKIKANDLKTLRLPIEVKKGDYTISIKLSSHENFNNPKAPSALESFFLHLRTGNKIPLYIILAGLFLVLVAVLLPDSGPQIRNVPQIVQQAPNNRDSLSSERSIFRVIDAINAANLSRTLDVTVSGDQLRISGSLSENQAALLRSIIERNDPRGRNIETNISPLPEEAPTRTFIAGVQFSPSKYVIDPNGRQLRIGDEVYDGWRIDAIERDEVIIKKDVFTISIPI
jgi:hypothetical protein